MLLENKSMKPNHFSWYSSSKSWTLKTCILPKGLPSEQFWGSKQAFRQHYSRRRRVSARTSLLIEARRTRPDPIIAPYIVSDKGRGHEEYTDMYQHLLANRIIFVGSRITDEVATATIAKLLALESINSAKDIKLYLNSAGGSAYAVIGIIDTLRFLKPDVSTICVGQTASTASLLLAAGTKGKRLSLPSSRIMIHQPSGGAMGSSVEVNITTSELNRTMRVVQKFYSEFTGQTVEKMEEETDRDTYMSPQQAIDLGVIDAII